MAQRNRGLSEEEAEEVAPRRGRPPGRTPEGHRTRKRLYKAALKLIAARGYEATTLRDIAKHADVSAALLYRYFPSKRAVVLALHEELSREYAEKAELSPGSWRDRFAAAVEATLEVLGPHRTTLRALIPVLVMDEEEGLFSPASSPARAQVEKVFLEVVSGAADAPRGLRGEALGRLLYVAHLGIVMWWLLDKSPQQRATHGLLKTFRKASPMMAMFLKLPMSGSVVESLDKLCGEALFGPPARPRRAPA